MPIINRQVRDWQERTGVVEYDVHTTRPFAGALGTDDMYDVLPCEVQISVKFLHGKHALEFERKVRAMLEPDD